MDDNDEVIMFYNQRIETEHDTHAMMGYGSPKSQQARFDALLRIGDLNGRNVLDIGCGTGDFAKFLKSRNQDFSRYVGADIVLQLVSMAKRNSCPENTEFHVMDILDNQNDEFLNSQNFDYAFMCGTFNLNTPNHYAVAKSIILKAFRISHLGIAFNMTSLWGRELIKDTHTVCYDPLEIMAFCRKISRRIVFMHDYLPHDFTIFLYKD